MIELNNTKKISELKQIIQDLLSRINPTNLEQPSRLAHGDPLAVRAINALQEYSSIDTFPKNFVKEGLELAEGATLYGKKL